VCGVWGGGGGGKRPVHTAGVTTFMCRLSRNSASLKLLDPYGPVQACNGIAVTFTSGTKSGPRPQSHSCTVNLLSFGCMGMKLCPYIYIYIYIYGRLKIFPSSKPKGIGQISKY